MMAGLLGDFEDPQRQGLLALGLGLLNSRGNFGQGLGQAGMQAMDVMRQAKMDQQRKAQMEQAQQMQQMQMQQAQAQMAAQQQAREKQAAVEGAYRGAMRSPDQVAMAANGGPTVAAAQAAPNAMPQIDQSALIRNLMQADPMAAYQMLQPKPADYKVVGDALVSVGPTGVKEAYRAPTKPEKDPEAIRALKLIHGEGTPAYQAALEAYGRKMTTHQPGTSVSVNTGQRGFDNTLKLRSDFRSEPVYKAHQEMQSAYSQIQQSLKQASPAGDLAGATKLMKLLDPGSVVRESELGMAMAASGLLDRVQNYAQNIMSGNKLTPTQRADFQRLADALFTESVNHYNNKRAEYEGIAKRNELNTGDVVGSEAKAPRVVNFGDMK